MRPLVLLLLAVSVFASDIVVIGHRGHGCSGHYCSSTLPENSIPAFLAGRSEGADRVELDTWLTADNQIIVVHGGSAASRGTLKGTTVNLTPGGSTPIVELFPYENITRFPVKMPWAVEKPDPVVYETDDYRVPYAPRLALPLLRDVMKAVCPTGVRIQVEMKGNNPALGPAIISLVQSMGMTKCIHGLSSFFWGKFNGPIAADLFKPIAGWSPLPIFLLFNMDNYPLPAADLVVAAVREYNASGIHPKFSEFDEPKKTYILDRAKKEGFAVMSWTPGSRTDTEAELRHLIEKGVKEICTNEPGLLRRIINEMETKERRA